MRRSISDKRQGDYVDGVFKPLEDVKDARPGQIYRIFSEDELPRLTEDMGWLKAAERSFDFWYNEDLSRSPSTNSTRISYSLRSRPMYVADELDSIVIQRGDFS